MSSEEKAYMKKKLEKSLLLLVMALTIISFVFADVMPVQAAVSRKCYTISSGNTAVYSNSGLSRRSGTIFGSDELTVVNVSRYYSYVGYPGSGGKIRYGFISTGSILKSTGGSYYTCSRKTTTYKRPGGASYGYISAGDSVMKLGTQSGYTQIKYPLTSGGYKYGWIKGDIPTDNYVSISTGIYTIATSLNTGYVLDVNNYACFNGANVEIFPYHKTNNEHWKITDAGSGYYRIQDVNSGKVLDVSGGSSASGTNVQIWESNNTNAQKWRFYNAGNNYYYIKNANGCFLDVSGGCVSNGNNVWVYSGNGTGAQKWRLTGVNVNTSSNSTSSGSSSQKSFTSFSQKDSRWSGVAYGYSDVSCRTKAYLKESGCGILAMVNAVYYLNGKFIDPGTLAAYSLNNGYRVNGAGTSIGLYKSFCDSKGSSYGIKYITALSNISDLKDYLTKGNVAVVNVEAHFVAVVAYDSDSQKYLVLDSYPASSRGTSSGYRWMKSSEFIGKMAVKNGIRVIGKR